MVRYLSAAVSVPLLIFFSGLFLVLESTLLQTPTCIDLGSKGANSPLISRCSRVLVAVDIPEATRTVF